MPHAIQNRPVSRILNSMRYDTTQFYNLKNGDGAFFYQGIVTVRFFIASLIAAIKASSVLSCIWPALSKNFGASSIWLEQV